MMIKWSELVGFGVVTLLMALICGPLCIGYLQRKKTGATILEELPENHQVKAGTPLMGGLIFAIPMILVGCYLLVTQSSYWRQIMVFYTYFLGFGYLGFIDDYRKAFNKRAQGLTVKEKLLGQSIIVLLYLIIFFGQEINTALTVPFIGFQFDMGYLYIPFLFVVAVGASNAVNLTDGMDGLLAGCMIFSSLTYLFVFLVLQNRALALLIAALIGALIGYLRYNYFPAKIFMGDTGSLALGGALTAFAILSKTELLLLIIGGVYVLEALSVILQVSYFKITKGKRIFKMSPLHHHFDLSGWSELKVVWSFWLVSGICGILGILGLVRMI